MRKRLTFANRFGAASGPGLWAPAVAALAAAVVVALDAGGGAKLTAAAVGGVLLLVGANLSGNPRLYCLWGLMLTIPFDLSKRFGEIIAKMGGENSIRLEFSDLFIAVLLVYVARDIASGRLRGLRIPKVSYVWLAIAAMGLGAMFFGTYRVTAMHEVFRMLKVAVLFVVVCNELTTTRRVLHAAGGLTMGVLLQALVGMYQYVTRQHLGLDILGETGAGTLDQLAADSVRTEGVFRVGAFLNHPNIFGAFLAALLPLALGLYLLTVGRWFRLLALLAATFGLAALMASLSRSGWGSFAVAAVALLGLVLLHGRLRMKALLPAAGAALVLTMVLIAFSGQIFSRLFESKPDAVLGRSEYTQTAMGVIRAKPLLGWGLNSYVYVAPNYTRFGPRATALIYKNWLPPVHNIYLLWWAETGLLGLGLHLVMLAMIIRTGLQNLKVRDETLFMISAACMCGVVALMLDGFLSFTLRINSVLRVFWVLAAIIMAVHYRHLGQGLESGSGDAARPTDP